MSAGYGRGYYGSAQLAPPRSRGNGWFKIAAAVGLGAAVWWWVLPAIGSKPKYTEPPPAPPAHEDLGELARSRGFSSTQMYEDAMVASLRELKAAGAKIELAPHLAHLGARLESCEISPLDLG